VILEAGQNVTPNVRLKRPLGSGGMGSVWVADQLTTGSEVAVKFLSPELAKDAGALARFGQEAAAASQVKSAHVVKIFDHGTTGTGAPFIVMELLDGQDLGARLDGGGPLTPEALAPILTQLGRALEKAHERGIVHRDVKPGNVFLSDEGGEVFVKLLDFGIAKAKDLTAQGISGKSTRAGEVLGTPFYMSPEQALGERGIGPATDIWAVGVVAYEALTGQLPFDGETMGALAVAIHNANAKPMSSLRPELPAALDAWFSRACAQKPGDRFASR
jgi:eukaryotic-like serine/threonine-protein kinase